MLPSDTTSAREYRTAMEDPVGCCCCCGLKAGVTTINIISLLLIWFAIFFTAILMFDEYFPWWYIAVNSIFVLGLGTTAIVFIY